MLTTKPTLIPGDEQADQRLAWIGVDDRGLELEIVALVLADTLVVIHVMPTALRSHQ